MKTTREDFVYFKKRCLYWIDRLGITGWELHWAHEEMGGVRGQCAANFDKIATLALDKTWDIEPTRKELERTAFHEAGELLLVLLDILARYRFSITESDLDKERHTIINRLASALGVGGQK